MATQGEPVRPSHPPPPSYPSFPPQLFLHLERLPEHAWDSSAHRFQFHSPCQLPLPLVIYTLVMGSALGRPDPGRCHHRPKLTGSLLIFPQIFMGVELICSAVFLFSGSQQSESALHIHTPTLFQILFPYSHYITEY